MRAELLDAWKWVKGVAAMEPASAVAWLRDEHLLGNLQRAIERIEALLCDVVDKPPDEVEQATLKLDGGFGNMSVQHLAQWVRDLPLLPGYSVTLETWGAGISPGCRPCTHHYHIVVTHIAAKEAAVIGEVIERGDHYVGDGSRRITLFP